MRENIRELRVILYLVGVSVLIAQPAFAQEGSVLTSLQSQITTAAKGWETTVMDAAKSLFWILATIEIGIAAVWLALQAASLDSWFAELVRRIMFVGFFAFVLTQGPTFAKAVVDSLFQIGAGGGTASPADVFNAGLAVATKMSEKVQFGLFEDNALAISAAFAMVVTVIAFSLVAAIFVSVMVEMYLGLLAGMIMLGLGGSSFTKDFGSISDLCVLCRHEADGAGDDLANWLRSSDRTCQSTEHWRPVSDGPCDRRHRRRGLHHCHVRAEYHAGRRAGRFGDGRDGNNPSRRASGILRGRRRFPCGRSNGRRLRCRPICSS